MSQVFATVEVMDWLRDRMAKGGAEAGAVQKEARQVGISDKALRRAREKLGIKPRKRSFAEGWWWEINPAAQGAQGAYNAVPKDKRVVRQGKKAKAEPAEDKLKEARGTAELATHPAVNAAMVIKEFCDHFGDLSVAALAVHLTGC